MELHQSRRILPSLQALQWTINPLWDLPTPYALLLVFSCHPWGLFSHSDTYLTVCMLFCHNRKIPWSTLTSAWEGMAVAQRLAA